MTDAALQQRWVGTMSLLRTLACLLALGVGFLAWPFAYLFFLEEGGMLPFSVYWLLPVTGAFASLVLGALGRPRAAWTALGAGFAPFLLVSAANLIMGAS